LARYTLAMHAPLALDPLADRPAASVATLAFGSLRGKTILQVIPRLDAGGAERTTVEVAQALVNAGARALVASEGGRLAAELTAFGAEVIELAKASSKNPLTIWNNAGRLAALICKNDVSLVHARSRAPAWSALWAARRTKTAFVTTYHGTYNAKSGLKRFYNSVMARGDLVIANSEFTREHVLREHAVAPELVVTIPRGIDPEAFADGAISSSRLRSAAGHAGFNLALRVPRIVLPGRLTAWKGQAQFIDALAKVRDQGLEFQAALVGDAQGRDAYLESLQTAIEAHKLTSRVTLAGHYSDIPALLKVADVVAAPSQEPEAFGRVAIEAQAAGRPVLVCDHGGQRETVEHGVTGLKVPPGDADALTDALAQFLRMSGTERQDMGRRGQARVSERYTVAALQKATLAVYRRVLEPAG